MCVRAVVILMPGSCGVAPGPSLAVLTLILGQSRSSAGFTDAFLVITAAAGAGALLAAAQRRRPRPDRPLGR
jgi:hypothetical protein